jgi:amidase
MDELLNRSAVAICADLRAGQVSAERLMAATLAHIAEVNPRLNAIVSLRDDDDLMMVARAADAADPVGPLHGLPIAVKDLANVAGLPTSMGSPALAGSIAQTSDIMVRRMQDAGAIVIGKTNTPAFGLGSHTTNPVFGPTENALVPGTSAGGSSGGAAVALASHMVALADGSDMMGSLRNPAGWNGVYGLRPTWGRVPSEPVGDVFLHQLATNGPMARHAADLALLLDVQSGPDPRQPHGCAVEPVSPHIKEGKRPRLAWLGDWGGAYPMEAGVLETCEAALHDWNAEIIAPPLPAADLWEAWTTLRSWSVATGLGPLYAQAHTRKTLNAQALWEIEKGRGLSVSDINRATLIRSQWFARAATLFETYDALVLPTAQCFPFPIHWDWPHEIGGVAMETYHRWMEVVIPASLIGLPAVAVPIAGQAMGLQFIGARGADLRLLQIGHMWDTAGG